MVLASIDRPRAGDERPVFGAEDSQAHRRVERVDHPVGRGRGRLAPGQDSSPVSTARTVGRLVDAAVQRSNEVVAPADLPPELVPHIAATPL